MNKYKFLGLMVITISMYAMDEKGAKPEDTLSELEKKFLDYAQTHDGFAVHDLLLDGVEEDTDDYLLDLLSAYFGRACPKD